MFCLQLMGKILPHHIGHYLGMDTHDTMAVDRNTILAPGMAITIEPGLYITEEHARYSGPSSLLKELVACRFQGASLSEIYYYTVDLEIFV